jgi:hypothetical protein
VFPRKPDSVVPTDAAEHRPIEHISVSEGVLLVGYPPEEAARVSHLLLGSEPEGGAYVCSDGFEALEYVFSTGRHTGRPPAEDLRVMLVSDDLPWPGASEVLRRVRSSARFEGLPVVGLSRSARTIPHDAGLQDVVAPPETVEEMRDLLRRWGVAP